MKRNKTVMERLCEAAKNDPLVVAFIVDAVIQKSERLAKASAEGREQFANCLVSYEAWNDAGLRCVMAVDENQKKYQKAWVA